MNGRIVGVSYYVTFLMRASGMVVEDSVGDVPSPRCPEDPSVVKVTCDARGEVSVREHHHGPPQLIGIATWDGKALSGFRQEQAQVPSDAKWIAIAKAVERELEKRAARGGPEDASLVEKISRGDRRRLYARNANWAAMGPRYDRKGVDRYAMRRFAWILGLGTVAIVGAIAVCAVFVFPRSSVRQPRPASSARPASRATTTTPTPSPPTVEKQVEAAATFADAIRAACSSRTTRSCAGTMLR
jgi:hypothetical protein